MTSYATQAVIWPPVPADLLDELTKSYLTTCGIQWEDTGEKLRLFAEDGPYNQCHYFDDDREPVELGYVELLQEIIVRSASRLKALTIEAADTCEPMRPDGFGGWGMVITAQEAHYMSTYQWVRDKVRDFGLEAAVYGSDTPNTSKSV